MPCAGLLGVRDALFAALKLDIFMCHADRVRLTNIDPDCPLAIVPTIAGKRIRAITGQVLTAATVDARQHRRGARCGGAAADRGAARGRKADAAPAAQIGERGGGDVRAVAYGPMCPAVDGAVNIAQHIGETEPRSCRQLSLNRQRSFAKPGRLYASRCRLARTLPR
jgi:hypothetical protein